MLRLYPQVASFSRRMTFFPETSSISIVLFIISWMIPAITFPEIDNKVFVNNFLGSGITIQFFQSLGTTYYFCFYWV